jgi:hypothetical protein
MKELDKKKQLSYLMNKALTQVGALFVKHKTVRFTEELMSGYLWYRFLKVLMHRTCRAYLVRADMDLKSNMKISIGIHQKIASGTPHQINNSEGWYQNVLFGGGVPKPCYK